MYGNYWGNCSVRAKLTKNIGSLMKQPDIDGALVGRASLDAEHFVEIIQYGE